MDSNGTPVICEVCGTYFETRRGLSSHARLHLRQLGVSMSESSGAPIELLYKIIEEKDVSLSNLESTSPGPVQNLSQKAAKKESTTLPKDKGSSSKAWSKVMTVSQKTGSRASPPGFKEYAASLFSPQRGADIKISDRSNSTSVGLPEPVTKPLWAPQETDAPLTLASNSKDEAHVCQLCGAWYETRKGLSSHARAHLRQIGVTESGDGKGPGGPIELLYEIIKAEDLKPGSSSQQEPFNLHSPAKATTKRPSASPALLQAPPSKRAKTSEDLTCILCGEQFENRKGLGSHSRSHLRQIGVSHLLEKASAIETVQELVSSGVLAGVRPLETNNTTSSISAPSPSLSLSPTLSPTPARSTQSPPSSANRAPKAKKGGRLAVDPLSRKPKPEATEMFFPISPERYSNSSSPAQKLSSPAVIAERSQSHTAIPLVQCEACSQLFDSRKALSCHVRAHLRQLGIAWSVNESPIDLLRDVMAEVKKEATSGGRSASGLPMWAPQGPKSSLDRHMLQDPPNKHYTPPLDFSLKEKSSPGKSGSMQAVSVTSCELCGFDFDNRKALASHARAHLRQLGATGEWKADGTKGSPIELLSEFIQKQPAKVAEITRRYRTGDLFIKKTQKSALSPAPSTDSDSVSGNPLGRQSVQRVYLFNGESSKATQERPHAARSHMQARAACTDLSVRSSTGFWPQKGSMAAEEENSQQASRSGNIPALLPRPPSTPLVKLVGKVYSLKCRFCDEVFQGPLSVQGDWIRHLQKHILSLGYRGKASPLPTSAAAPALVGPVAV